MALWVVRAGRHGENETYALDNNLVVIGWEGVGDLANCTERDHVGKLVAETYPDDRPAALPVWTGELWAIRTRINPGDLVVLPLKTRSALAVGRIAGPYQFDAKAPFEAKHQRSVKWIRKDLPRSDIDQDILFSFGSTLTVFQVTRNDAEQRVLAAVQGKKQLTPNPPSADLSDPTGDATPIDLEQFVRDQVSKFISQKFRGHDLSRLVAGILTAQGYQVQSSPPGADGGVDIVAGQGPMGFDPPRMAVQVKSSDSPVDVGVLRELQGVMPTFGADRGLIVSWGGFKDSVLREARKLFFSIRLWDAGDLVTALQQNYERLPPDLQAEIPLRHVWLLAPEE